MAIGAIVGLSEFSAGLQFTDLPPEVVKQAKVFFARFSWLRLRCL